MSVQEANQSQVRIESFKGEKALVKKVVHPEVPGVRNVEWWMLKREAEILQRLEELRWVPDFLGYPGPYSFAMRWREGESLREIDPASLPGPFFEELGEAVQAIHRCQVTHSDLKRRENVLVDPQSSPVIIDFGASFRQKSGWRPVNNWLYEQFRQIDLNAVSKYKSRYAPQLCEPEDKKRLNNPVFLEKLSKFGREYILFRG